MKSLKRILLFVLVPLALVAAVMMGCNVGQYEEPAYTVVDSAKEGIELRHYAPALAAEVTVRGERKEAISLGFRMIADFIFGNNAPRQNIAMTAPVIQQPSEKIAMTAPVISQEGAPGQWRVQFIMPSKYTRETLPAPVNPEVKIKPIAERTLAVIRFAGSNKDDRLIADKITILQAYLVTRGLKPQSAPILAFYDPPWTLPFLRRNEVMIEVKAPSPAKKR